MPTPPHLRISRFVRPGSSAAQCVKCDCIFKSVSGFDYHRVNGECVPPEQRGMKQNSQGFWILKEWR